jgi:hypothetical protein
MDKRKGQVEEVTEKELDERLAGDNRRIAERIPAELEVNVPLASWEQFRRVYTKNISRGGLMFTMPSPSSIPAALELTLTLPDGSTVVFQAEVRHVARKPGTQEFEVGVQFRLDEETERKLEWAITDISKKITKPKA